MSRTNSGREKGSYSEFRKVRKIAHSPTGDVFGVTIPSQVAQKFSGTKLSLHTSGNAIILQSGGYI